MSGFGDGGRGVVYGVVPVRRAELFLGVFI
jgi:hypothetical protein